MKFSVDFCLASEGVGRLLSSDSKFFVLSSRRATAMPSTTCVLFFLAALAAPVLSGPYSNKCHKGPEYWCANFRTADECRAIGHCLQTVWTKQKYEIDHDIVANKFTKLFDGLKHKHKLYTDEALQATLDSTCRSIPHVAAGLRCKELMADRGHRLRGMFASELSAGAMCSVLSLCNDDKMDRLLAAPKHAKVPLYEDKKHLVGANRCTWGPSYWCENISNSHECHAVKHCISAYWVKNQVPEDNDDVCSICKDMVKQARDQLQSNETQEELKEVFEGSCKLIPLKIVAKECSKLADDFVPELVETLASEMNPTQVCSVAGLCNSERIDKLLAVYHERKSESEKSKRNCSGCRKVVSIARTNFDNTKYEDFLHGLLKGCRGFGSLSDACSTHVFSHYERILEGIREHLKPDSVCHLSGQCVGQYHSHAEEYAVGDTEQHDDNDELPCELCEQLVKHFRDVVVANTTETEFYKVLKGLCHQMGSFKSECLSVVEQWYPVIYNYLVSDLKPNEVCKMAGICAGGNDKVPIAPLFPNHVAVKAITPSSRIGDQTTFKSVKLPTKTASVRVLGKEQDPVYALPMERMFPVMASPRNKNGCALCQYILHFVQVEISDSKNEAVIKGAVEKACQRLPRTVSDECTQFVEAYGPAVVALLVQEIDPSSVCPALGICPKTAEVKRVNITAGHSSCPLCLFAVEQLETVLHNNKTEERIRKALESLCKPLSEKLKPECIDFVDQYSDKLVEMLLADMSAQEICVYLKICTDQKADPLHLQQEDVDKYHDKPYLRGDINRIQKKHHGEVNSMIETNAIPDSTYNGLEMTPQDKSSCVICEFVMKELDGMIKDKKNEDDLKRIVHGICKRLPKSVRTECDDFVDKYADLVVALLAQELDPDEVCRELKLCPSLSRKQVKENILDCAVCETVVMAVDKVLHNKEVDHRVVHVMEKACIMLPAKYYDRCTTLMEIYGDSVISIITQYGAKGTCKKIGLCGAYEGAYVDMFRDKKTRA